MEQKHQEALSAFGFPTASHSPARSLVVDYGDKRNKVLFIVEYFITA